MTLGVSRGENTPDSTKARFRAVFIALSADAKEFPGGIKALAAMEGRNGQVLTDQINPDSEKSPPPLGAFIEIIEATGGRRTLNTLNFMTGRVAIPIANDDADSDSETTLVEHFIALAHECGKATEQAADAIKDKRLTAEERQRLAISFESLIATAAKWRAIL